MTEDTIQQQTGSNLITLANNGLKFFETSALALVKAEELLDQAELDFKEGAFAPFWDSIEQATFQLGQFEYSVGGIAYVYKAYVRDVKIYESMPPQFPISVESVQHMTIANGTSDRMKAMVRNAQCNFQFASIYEQRKTNQVLESGFTNLAQALDGIGRKIAESVEGLQEQISNMLNRPGF